MLPLGPTGGRLHLLMAPGFSMVGPALLRLMKRRGLTGAEMMQRLGVGRSTLYRVLDEGANPESATIDRYLAAIGATAHELVDEMAAMQGLAAPTQGRVGTPDPDYVAALARRGIVPDVLLGIAIGVVSQQSSKAEADFVASACAASEQLARFALETIKQGNGH